MTMTGMVVVAVAVGGAGTNAMSCDMTMIRIALFSISGLSLCKLWPRLPWPSIAITAMAKANVAIWGGTGMDV